MQWEDRRGMPRIRPAGRIVEGLSSGLRNQRAPWLGSSLHNSPGWYPIFPVRYSCRIPLKKHYADIFFKENKTWLYPLKAMLIFEPIAWEILAVKALSRFTLIRRMSVLSPLWYTETSLTVKMLISPMVTTSHQPAWDCREGEERGLIINWV